MMEEALQLAQSQQMMTRNSQCGSVYITVGATGGSIGGGGAGVKETVHPHPAEPANSERASSSEHLGQLGGTHTQR